MHRAKQFFAKYGVYLVLFVCVAGVAAASYYAVSGVIDEINTIDESEQDEWQPTENTQDDVEISQPPQSSQPQQSDSQPPQASDTSEVSAASSQVIEPVEPQYVLPAQGSVSAAFSNGVLVKNETLGDWRTHNGVDIAAADGSGVFAVYGGKVVSAGKDSLWGWQVVLLLDSGYTAVYGNLGSVGEISAGDRVERGDQIGTVGSSSVIEAADAPHLHFEILSGDSYIDPAALLSF